MTIRLPFALVTVALVLAACGSSTARRPTANTGQVSAPARPSASAAAGGCPPGGGYCDSFADAGSGWPREQDDRVSAGYAGGEYVVTAFHLATVTEAAPVDVHKYSASGSVRVSTVATPGHFLPPSSLGLGCWLDPATGARSQPSGYVFLLDDLEATLSVWDRTTGEYRELVKDDAPGALHVHGSNRLEAECQRTGQGAAFRLTVNGNLVLGATFSDVSADGNAVGVAVHGARAEVHFDDVAVAGL